MSDAITHQFYYLKSTSANWQSFLLRLDGDPKKMYEKVTVLVSLNDPDGKAKVMSRVTCHVFW